MKGVQLSFLDYLSEAFHASPPVGGFGPLPMNKLIVAGVFILGFANPGFWFIGLALELTYLWMLSTHPRFQRWVKAKRMNVIENGQSQRMQTLMNTLDPASVARLEKLNANLTEINNLMDLHSDGARAFAWETKQKTLGQLPVVFLKLLVTRRLVCDSLDRTDVDKLKSEIRDLTKQLDTPDLSEALVNSLRGTIEIQNRRLDNIRKAQDNLRLVEMELNRIENQLQLIREEIALDRSPEALSSNIDRINSTLGETEAWIETHSDFLSRLGPTQSDVETMPVMPRRERE